MGFLAPLFLVGLLAAAIPIAIHLIRRENPPKIVFSTLRFFQKTTRKQFLFQQIQQWLLLLLRAVAIALVVFAFARPFVSQNLSRWVDAAPHAVAILMDVSMSMAYEDYLPEARAAAKSVLDDLNPGDQAALILFSDKTETVHGLTADLATLRTAIDSVEAPSYGRTRYFPPLRLADEILQDSPFDVRTVYLISDYQAVGLTDFDATWKLHPGVQFVAENVGRENTRNLAVTGVKAPAYWRTGTEEEDIFVRVRTLGSVRQQTTELRVALDGEEQIRQPVELRDQSEVVINVPIKFANEGSHVGKVSIADDGFAPDNDFYFTVDVLPKIRVLAVNGEAARNWYEDEGHWFGLALGSDKQSPFELTTIEPSALSEGQLRDHDVVVLLNVGSLNNGQAQALVDYVIGGGNLLVAPGDRVNAGTFNSQFGAVAPATLLQQISRRNDDYLLIADIERRHPILRPLNVDWNVRFEGSWALKPQADTEVLMKFDNGNPALVERGAGEGRVLMLASALDTEWNNLPLKGMYLPFVHEMLKYLAHTPEKKPSYVVGEKIELLGSLSVDARLVDPTGNVESLQEGESSFTLNEPGVYRNINGDNEIYYAVNTPVEESDFASIAPADILDRILNPETKPTQSAAVRSQLLKEELERPQRIWWWLLALAAALLIAESVISNRTHR